MVFRKQDKIKSTMARRYKIIITAVFILMAFCFALSFLIYADNVYKSVRNPSNVLKELVTFAEFHERIIDKDNPELSDHSDQNYSIFIVTNDGLIIDTNNPELFPLNGNILDFVGQYDEKKKEELAVYISMGNESGDLSHIQNDRTIYYHYSKITSASNEYYLFATIDDLYLTELANSIIFEAVLLFVVLVGIISGVAIFFIIWFNKRNVQLLEFNERLHYLKEQYEIALSHTNHLMFEYNMLTRTVIFPNNAGKLFRAPDTIDNVPDDDVLSKLIHNDDLEKYKSLFLQAINGESFVDVELRIKSISGEYVWNNVSLQIINDLSGKPIKAIGFMEDISDYIKAKTDAENEAIVKKTLFNMYLHGFEVNITRDKFISGEHEICEVVGLTPPVSFSKLVNHIIDHKLNKDDAEAVKNMYNVPYIQHCYDNKRNVIFECRWNSRRRGVMWLAIMVSFFRNAEGEYLALFLVSDIDDIKKESLTLIDKAKYDSATNLLNKASTEDQIKSIISSSRGTNRIHAIVMIDLDNLKAINDNLGHMIGDKCISDLANTIKKIVRSTDIAGRVGGDEFIVFLNDIRDKNTVIVRVEELINEYRQLAALRADINYSFSAGISFYKNGMLYEDLYKTADVALYRSKKHGGNTYTIYSETDKDCE